MLFKKELKKNRKVVLQNKVKISHKKLAESIDFLNRQIRER